MRAVDKIKKLAKRLWIRQCGLRRAEKVKYTSPHSHEVEDTLADYQGVMSELELAPPITFTQFDKLQLKGFAENVENFLLREHDCHPGSLVLSLDGRFGAGKSTFLTMWRNDLADRHQNDRTLPVPILINAWQDDFCSDPLLSLASAFQSTLENHIELADEHARESALDALKRIGRITASIGYQVVEAKVGVDLKSIVESGADPVRESDQLTAFNDRKAAHARLIASLRECFGGDSVKAIVMVDELDRCRPSYAIEYLETIKHIFDIHGLCFVLAVDLKQLRSCAVSLFGALDFNEYFRKFVHRKASLPTLSPEVSTQYFESLTSKYLDFQEDPNRHCLFASSRPLNDAIKVFTRAFEMTPRQIEELFRIMRHVGYHANKKAGTLHASYAIVAIYVICLSIANPENFDLLGRRGLGFRPVYEQVSSVLEHLNLRDKDRWAVTIGLSAYNINEQAWEDDVLNAARSLNLLDRSKQDTIEEFKSQFAIYIQMWQSVHVIGTPLFDIYDHVKWVKSFN